MEKYKTLILNEKIIKKLVNIKDALKAIETAFMKFGQGRVQMPPKLYIHLDKYNGDLRAMPGYVDGMGCCIKWVNVHPRNRNKGLPTVMGLIIFTDPKTGFPLCIMDGTYATALRTGAAGGIAAKYLARKNSKIVGLVGCGVQAKVQLEALNELFNIKQVNIWALTRSECNKFINKLRKLKKLNINISDTVKDCVEDADIIVTTTPSRKPLVKLEWLKKGVHINAIGADAKGKQELDPKILKKAKLIVDSWEQASHSGEINVAVKKGYIKKKDVYADIGEIISGKKKIKRKKDEITVFDSTGLSVQDVAIVSVIYKKALKEKKGRYINFI